MPDYREYLANVIVSNKTVRFLKDHNLVTDNNKEKTAPKKTTKKARHRKTQKRQPAPKNNLTPMSTLAVNKRANYDYEILKNYEAGLVLTGQEVKAVRAGQINLKAVMSSFMAVTILRSF